MLKAKGVRTKSVRKARKPIVIDAMIIVVVATITLGFWLVKNSGEKLRVNGYSYKLSVAKTPTQQGQALGRHANLPSNQGILFSYSNQARRCFNMQGTHIPFDMIWTDADKKVVAVAHDVTAAAYPKICSASSAQYVIGLNAGQAEAANIQAGQTLSF